LSSPQDLEISENPLILGLSRFQFNNNKPLKNNVQTVNSASPHSNTEQQRELSVSSLDDIATQIEIDLSFSPECIKHSQPKLPNNLSVHSVQAQNINSTVHSPQAQNTNSTVVSVSQRQCLTTTGWISKRSKRDHKQKEEDEAQQAELEAVPWEGGFGEQNVCSHGLTGDSEATIKAAYESAVHRLTTEYKRTKQQIKNEYLKEIGLLAIQQKKQLAIYRKKQNTETQYSSEPVFSSRNLNSFGNQISPLTEEQKSNKRKRQMEGNIVTMDSTESSPSESISPSFTASPNPIRVTRPEAMGQGGTYAANVRKRAPLITTPARAPKTRRKVPSQSSEDH